MNVLHSLFESRQLVQRDTIGKPGAAFVKKYESLERCEEMMLPEVFEMRDPAHYEDDVDVAFAEHLVSDVYIAALDVMRFRDTSRKQISVNGRQHLDRTAIAVDINPGMGALDDLDAGSIT